MAVGPKNSVRELLDRLEKVIDIGLAPVCHKNTVWTVVRADPKRLMPDVEYSERTIRFNPPDGANWDLDISWSAIDAHIVVPHHYAFEHLMNDSVRDELAKRYGQERAGWEIVKPTYYAEHYALLVVFRQQAFKMW